MTRLDARDAVEDALRPLVPYHVGHRDLPVCEECEAWLADASSAVLRALGSPALVTKIWQSDYPQRKERT